MKKPVQKILLLLITLYCFAAYSDIKQGFADGFRQKTGKPCKAAINENTATGFDGFGFPVIIKIY